MSHRLRTLRQTKINPFLFVYIFICSTTFLVLIPWLSFSSGLPADKTKPSTLSNPTKAGEFIIEIPTLVCAGFEWMIYGDANRNASVSVVFRKKGNVEWKQGLLWLLTL